MLQWSGLDLGASPCAQSPQCELVVPAIADVVGLIALQEAPFYGALVSSEAIEHVVDLPNGIRIGANFLLSFDDPDLAAAPYQGRLQDFSKDGLLCVDAPLDMRPPRGTAVTVHSIRNQGAADFSFASEIRGRGRLKGRLPVLLLRPPVEVEERQRRSAYRISVCLRAQIECVETTLDGERMVPSEPCG